MNDNRAMQRGRKVSRPKLVLIISGLTLLFPVLVEIFFRVFVGPGPWEGPAALQFTPVGNPAQVKAILEKSKGRGLLGIIEDRRLFWRLAPNSTTSVHASVDTASLPLFAEHTFTTNSLGFRSPPVDVARPPGVYRIVCLGDSATFGSGVPDGSPYPDQLGIILRKNHPRGGFEVINAGVPGYSSFQGRVLFDTLVLKLKPDLVTLCFGANDAALVMENDVQTYRRRTGRLAALSFWMLRFKSYKWLRYNLMAAKRVGGQAMGGENKVPRVSGREFIENYRHIIEIARRNNIEAMLVERNMRFPGTGEKRVADLLHVANVPLYSALKEAVEGMVAGELYPQEAQRYRSLYGDELDANPALYALIDAGHPNELGHRIIAGEIYRKLEQMPGFKAYTGDGG